MSVDVEYVPKWKLLQRGKYNHRYGKKFFYDANPAAYEGINNPRYCVNLHPILKNKGWLEQRYVTEGKSMNAVAKEVCLMEGQGCTKRSIKRALEHHKIEIRSNKK